MLPEVAALHSTGSLIRIPQAQDVPVTPRVRRVLDTAAMRRLASIRQLGMVSLVYPGATHSRLEHSLGVYHNAVRFLGRFTGDLSFHSMIPEPMAEAFLFAALVHDIGHWPFCHPIEDMCLPGLGEHEHRVIGWLSESELAHCLSKDWSCDAGDVLGLLVPADELGLRTDAFTSARRFLSSCLSGPIDVDKLDYLQRDSLHAGVPYGRNFDAGRLINSLTIHPERPQLAVGEKGRTAAEMMVFSRYVMFSEVYWHHAVRAATAMLQRAVFLLQKRVDFEATFLLAETDWIATVRAAAESTPAEPLTEDLFGPRRKLYKRLAEFNAVDGAEIHRRLARRPYWWLVSCAEKAAERISRRTGLQMAPTDLLLDAPPVKLEVDIDMDVVSRRGAVRSLGEVSPVASALADHQFDNHVKRVRLFVREELRGPLSERFSTSEAMAEQLHEAIDEVESEMA